MTQTFEIETGTLRLRPFVGATCAWSRDAYGIVHHRADGTSHELQLLSFSAWNGTMPRDLSFSIAPNGDVWVWAARSLCHVTPDERVACGPALLGIRSHGEIGFARDGTIWFFSSFQTLVHARFVEG